MRKRMWRAYSHSKHKLGEKDRISQLPDEVIASILSRLVLREAARTSVLARRWETLWHMYTGCLDFDAMHTPLRPWNVKKERAKYVRWVNRVLESLDGPSNVNEFIIRFNLNEKYSQHIDKWIEFLFEKKRIKKLELNLMPVIGMYAQLHGWYSFPLQVFARMKHPSRSHNITALRDLYLKFVDVSGEIIEHFLSSCPLLERLFVSGTNSILSLKVTGPNLPLKYLELSYCTKLEMLEISALNLVSLTYVGNSIELHVRNVPRLAMISIGNLWSDHLVSLCNCLSKHISHLQTLRFDSDYKVDMNYMEHINLTKLKHLILCLPASCGESVLRWTCVINAAPNLQRFTLESINSASRSRIRRKLQKLDIFPHKNLKVVEFVGFGTGPTEYELALHLFENAVALEKVIIDFNTAVTMGSPMDIPEYYKKAAKKHALRLKQKLPPGVDFQLI